MLENMDVVVVIVGFALENIDVVVVGFVVVCQALPAVTPVSSSLCL